MLFQYLSRVLFGFYRSDNLIYNSVFIDYKCGTVDAVKQFTHKFFRTPYAKSINNALVFIGQKWKRKLIFFFKLLK